MTINEIKEQINTLSRKELRLLKPFVAKALVSQALKEAFPVGAIVRTTDIKGVVDPGVAKIFDRGVDRGGNIWYVVDHLKVTSEGVKQIYAVRRSHSRIRSIPRGELPERDLFLISITERKDYL